MGTTNQQALEMMKQKKIGKVMHEFGKGELHSGKGGKVVKDQKQALAIAISSAAKKMGRIK